jgi:hypothetical protein
MGMWVDMPHTLPPLRGWVDHKTGEPIESVPHFSSDLVAAWEVVERLQGEIDIHSDHGKPHEWRVHWTVIGPTGAPRSAEASAHTLPHAICLAALLVVGAI